MKFFQILTIIILTVFLCINTYAETPCSHQETILSLDQVIAKATEANHLIHISQIDLNASKEAKKEAFTQFLPKLKTEYGFTYLNEVNYVTLDNTKFFFGTQDNYRWTTSAVQNIFTGLAVLSQYQIADLEAKISEIKKADTKLTIILDAKKSFFAVQNAKLLVEVGEKAVRSLKDHLSIAREYYDVGLSPKIDVLNAEVDLAEVQQELEKAKNNVVVAKAALNNMIDLPVDTPIDTAGTLKYSPFPMSYEQCIEKAMELRPGIKTAAKKIEVAKKQIQLARSDYSPDITASINYNRFGDQSDLQGSDYEDRENWNAMLTATWTFWEWGKTRHSVLQSKEGLKKAIKQMSVVEDRVHFEVKDAYYFLQTAGHNITVAKKSIASAEENLRMSKERYKEQVAIVTEVLDAETRLTRARTFLTNALNDYNVAMATLYWAIGME
jgi:outer membrane protein